MFAVADYLDSVDEHMPDAFRVLMRFFIGGFVANGCRIEDYDIGIVARLQRATTCDLQVLCRQ